MTKKEKYIVNELLQVFRKYRDIKPVRMEELLRLAFEQEIGYTTGAKNEERIHKNNT